MAVQLTNPAIWSGPALKHVTGPLRVVIDGPQGAGKTILAAFLLELLGDRIAVEEAQDSDVTPPEVKVFHAKNGVTIYSLGKLFAKIVPLTGGDFLLIRDGGPPPVALHHLNAVYEAVTFVRGRSHAV